ncbi:MAG: GNAT family N-acetyltransferase, partial [Kofleriaceae bacterium]|nr:GNAT family N-acetyltransferase [Kofleriaceae bacterium]
MAEVKGACHCGQVQVTLKTEKNELPVRHCQCDHCAPQHLRYTSDPQGSVCVAGKCSIYQFATKTADFARCARCGFFIGAFCESQGLRAVLNADLFLQLRTRSPDAVEFGQEIVADRVARRARTWTPATWMQSNSCLSWEAKKWEFETDRLQIVGWRSRSDAKLAAFLAVALTENVTRELPPTWQSGVTLANAKAWIAERDSEGKMFLVETRGDATPIGVFMFFPDMATATEGQVRVGYVFAESAWGQGYASEVLVGFLKRWDKAGITAKLLAGVTASNLASQRVLEKAG